ncbi:FabD/lysophospholipase-like protein [Corynespora cassiicola Philippines]|uniref:FabD/lysophospholipase-like protein n=1 Tax=Corynespora cassiicola Philippines TaxID=1448308 RepID=A0A2T2NJH8_CORCC|nr:FabD/lysophospholipase-like protein [Corynespora cassiicola Philippines]
MSSLSHAEFDDAPESSAKRIKRSKTEEINPKVDSKFPDAETSEDAWKQRNILYLDGGGVRGYWSLLILKRLMKAIADEEREATKSKQTDRHHLHEQHSNFHPSPFPQHAEGGPFSKNERKKNHHRPEKWRDDRKYLPCHYFDLICGSSTGGLIAIMLSRFRMNIPDCLYEYKTMSSEIFGIPRPMSQRNLGFGWAKYSTVKMEKAFKNVIHRRCDHNANGKESSFKTVPGTCKAFVTVVRQPTSHPAVAQQEDRIRSYHSPNTSNDTDHNQTHIWKTWEAARAATAAPLYFKSFDVEEDGNGQKVLYFDGAFGAANNPTLHAIEEMRQNGSERSLGVVVSVGTARSPGKSNNGRGFFQQATLFVNRVTDPEIVAEKLMKEKSRDYDLWRFNDTRKPLDVELDEWKPRNLYDKSAGHETLGKIENHFCKWASKRKNIREIQRCARALVKRRRLRTKDIHLWEHYATCVQFGCPIASCDRSGMENREDFSSHMRRYHNELEDEEPNLLEWRYRTPPST